jgi:hypothetical protein
MPFDVAMIGDDVVEVDGAVAGNLWTACDVNEVEFLTMIELFLRHNNNSFSSNWTLLECPSGNDLIRGE